MNGLSHPNYRGYDAIEGKGVIIPEKRKLVENSVPLKLADLPHHCPREWRLRLEAVRTWCVENGLRFAISPYDYQLAKISSEDFIVVLWRSRHRRSLHQFIKVAFEVKSDSGWPVVDAIREILGRF